MTAFRPLLDDDVPLLHEWLGRAHVVQWWGPPPALAEVQRHYAGGLEARSSSRAYLALLDGQAVGFVQSYVVTACGAGWWPDDTDPGARGIDLFLADAESIGRGLGSRIARSFVDRLFQDRRVTRVQVDPSPGNLRAIGCFRRAGFVVRHEVVTPDGPALLMECRRPA